MKATAQVWSAVRVVRAEPGGFHIYDGHEHFTDEGERLAAAQRQNVSAHEATFTRAEEVRRETHPGLELAPIACGLNQRGRGPGLGLLVVRDRAGHAREEQEPHASGRKHRASSS